MFTHIDPATQIKMSTKEKKFSDLWVTILSNTKEEEKKWVEALKKAGTRAAHPDDAWVDRTNNIVTFVYPQFYYPLNPGDVIALGRPDKYRFVKVLEPVQSRFSGMIKWRFK